MHQDKFLDKLSHNCPLSLSVPEARRSSSSTPNPRTNGGVIGGGLISVRPPFFPLDFEPSFNHNFLKEKNTSIKAFLVLGFWRWGGRDKRMLEGGIYANSQS